MKIRSIFAALALSFLFAFQSSALVTQMTVGFFDLYFFNEGDITNNTSGTVYTGAYDWDLSAQLGSITAALETWSSVISNAPTRNIKVSLVWSDKVTSLAQASGSGRYLDYHSDLMTTTAEIVWRDEGIFNPGVGDYDIKIGVAASYYSQYSYSDTLNPLLFDFQSVIAHEIGHALGFASYGKAVDWSGSQYSTWDTLLNVNGFTIEDDDFLFALSPGATVTIGEKGNIVYNPYPYSSSSLSHIDKSNNPDALMQPSIGRGVRRELTELELQLMEEMGWSINWDSFYGVSVPEPSTASLLAFCSLYFITRRRRTSAAD